MIFAPVAELDGMEESPQDFMVANSMNWRKQFAKNAEMFIKKR